MNSLLSITNKAIIQINKILKNAPTATEGILVGIDKSGCNGYSYKLSFCKKNEVENFDFIEHKNIKVFIDPKATMFLIGSEMDYSSDKLSSRFIFKNPNEKSSCGCGESFSI